MTQHTKGPWHTGEGKAGIIIYNENGYAVADAKVLHTQFGGGHAEGLANARLIAAAPETAAERDRLKVVNAELLEALELAKLGIEAAIEKCPKNNDENFIGYALALDKINAAIAKAKGGAA